MRIALFAERRDGHAGLLIAALAKRGVEAVPVALKHCAVMTTAPHGLHIPGFEDGLPSGAFVRGIPAGSFEQVTVRLGFLHALRELGVPVWNDARAIETCIDKAMTSHLIAKAGLSTPATWTAQSLEAARAIAARETAGGHALVLKPLFGSQGRGLKLIRMADDLPDEDEPGIAGLYYLQRFVQPVGALWQDIRVFVCAGQAIAAMTRTGDTWITNVHQGGKPQALLLTDELRNLAVRAVAATGADYAGVDVIRGRDGALLVLEVNSMPAWTGLEQVNPNADVAQAIADAFVNVISRTSGPPLRMAALLKH